MKVLMVDEGNSRAKFVLFENNQFVELLSWQDCKKCHKHFDKIILASVQHDQNSIASELVAAYLNSHFMRLQTPKAAHGLVNAYSEYNRLGIDRWLAMLGARSLTQNSVIVIDAGTAVTVDAINQQGNHLGGYILPNVEFSANKLAQRSGKINLKQPEQPSVSLGISTETCVYNALYASQIALIKNIYQEISSSVNDNGDISIVLTGGNGIVYHNLLESIGIKSLLDNMLVFRGMSLYA